MPNDVEGIYLFSLGCPKNEVDSDYLISRIREAGWTLCKRPEDADILLVNTCSFIIAAVEESVQAILELGELKRKGDRRLVVTGCLVSRYGAEALATLLPEVDLFIEPERYGEFISLTKSLVSKPLGDYAGSVVRRDSSTLGMGYVYLKIAEGCRRRCAYCAIPSIRGPLRSRPWRDIREEMTFFLEHGAREIILIAQDVTSYGIDSDKQPSLHSLLPRLAELEGDFKIRLMYMHPEGVDERILKAMCHPKVYPYLDIPFQHADAGVLRSMGRKGDTSSHRRLLRMVREMLGAPALRATFMVGFPGEDEDAFSTLCEFVSESFFDWLGLFSYSQEEGTPAYSLGRGVSKTIARKRLEALSGLQEEIMREKALQMVGRRTRVLVEGLSREAPGFWEGRSWREAPEIDGVIFLPDRRGLGPAEWHDVVITGCEGIDLVGEIETWQEQFKGNSG